MKNPLTNKFYGLGTYLISTSLILLSGTKSLAQNNTAAFAGCTEARFVVGAATNQINTNGANYTPRCLKVKKGSAVTIQASERHPLVGAPAINNAVNPFETGTLFKASQTRVMDSVGSFGFYCEAHGDAEGDGMAGLIVVEE